MQKKRYILFSTILISLLCILILSFLLLLIFIFFHDHSLQTHQKHPKSLSYLEQKFSSSSHPQKRFTSLIQKLTDEEFLKYNTENGSPVIISKLGGLNYECKGTCSCTHSKRRTTGSLFTRPLTLIFSALSATLALSIAKEVFRDQCVQHFSDDSWDCDEEDIVSETDSCEIAKEELFKNKKKRRGYERFLCEGFCVPLEDVHEEDLLYDLGNKHDEKRHEFSELNLELSLEDLRWKNRVKCEELRVEGKIVEISTRQIHAAQEEDFWGSVGDTDSDVEYMIKSEFADEYLEPFCWEKSGVYVKISNGGEERATLCTAYEQEEQVTRWNYANPVLNNIVCIWEGKLNEEIQDAEAWTPIIRDD